MVFSLAEIVLLLNTYKYLILFPIVVVEGPITAIIAGFLVSLGILNPFLVYIIVVAGDVVGDSILYIFGRWGGESFIRRIGPYLGVTPERIDKVKEYFNSYGRRAVTMSKLFHGVGIAGLVTAGSLKVPYRKYIFICFSVTLAQAFVFLMVGVLFGGAYMQMSKYLDYFATATIAIGAGIILILAVRRYVKR
jgi:membrane protein DedA with SNARE-associated domain